MTSYQVTAQSLNIRQQPGVEGAIMGVLAYGEPVQATSAPLANEYWRQIQHVGQTGWVSDKYLRLVGNAPCPWMPIALAENGVTEIEGEQYSDRVLEYLHSTTLPEPERDQDETPWCSAFVNWYMGLKAEAKYVSGFESSDKIRPQHFEVSISTNDLSS